MTGIIVYTRRDGGVNLCTPSPNCLRRLAMGGNWGGQRRGFIDEQIDRQIADGYPEPAVVQFTRAMAFGGLTTAEALAVMRDRDCHMGVAHELYSACPDKWFRDAWVRSHNGGPIGIDMRKARKIQAKRIQRAAAKAKADLALPRWRERIRRAQDPEQLRQIWPKGLIL